MKAARVLLLGLLVVLVAVAFLVRRRAAESGEDYTTALQGLLTDAVNGRNEAWGHLQDALQDGRRAAGGLGKHIGYTAEVLVVDHLVHAATVPSPQFG